MSKPITPRGAVRIIDKYLKVCGQYDPYEYPEDERVFHDIILKNYLSGRYLKSWRNAPKILRKFYIRIMSEMIDRLTEIRDGLEQYEKEREG